MSTVSDPSRETRAKLGLLRPALRYLRPYWSRVLVASVALVFTAAASLSLGQGATTGVCPARGRGP